MLNDIQEQKPALNIEEGVFYTGFDNYAIRVGKKMPDGETIKDVPQMSVVTKSASRPCIFLLPLFMIRLLSGKIVITQCDAPPESLGGAFKFQARAIIASDMVYYNCIMPEPYPFLR